MKEFYNLFNTVKNILNPINRNVPNFFKPYYKSRTINDKKYLCHAPFNNIYFNSRGEVANCWLTFDSPEQYHENTSIKEIWFGEKFKKLRNNIKKFDLSEKCGTCLHHIESNNFVNVLSKAYDNNNEIIDYPTIMEFELSNICNLECTMCNGYLSSAIRKNRDHQPALKSPYGDKFISELREFIPYLKEARFNGGEPFMIKIYYDIWDLIFELNPNLKIVIATNGTILNDKIKSYLNKGNFHFNISIDSLEKDTYSKIRVNGDLDIVLKNFKYFKEYCQKNKRDICVMFNPMKNNWQEIPNFLEFCNNNDVKMWFNTIVYPKELSISNMQSIELNTVYTTLSKYSTNISLKHASKSIYNNKIYNNFIHQQLKEWYLKSNK